MAGMGILIVGILIAIAFMALSAAAIAMAPYIAIGVILFIVYLIVTGKDDEKPPK